MAKTLLLAWATPSSKETEAEFHAWYEQTHIPELRAAIPSITAANRYRLAPVMPLLPDTPAPPAAGRFLCIYEIDEADAETAANQLLGALGGGRVAPSTMLDMTDNPPALEWYQHL